MDKNIYERVCRNSGHDIAVIQENLFNIKTNESVVATTKLCRKCGGTDEELSKTPSGFAAKKSKNGESRAEKES